MELNAKTKSNDLLRDGNGSYKGSLEVSQDVTTIRQLEGEKCLPDDSL